MANITMSQEPRCADVSSHFYLFTCWFIYTIHGFYPISSLHIHGDDEAE